MKFLFRGILLLVVLFGGALAWDVWQLRLLRPPENRTFEGFLQDARHGSLLLDGAAGRLYWVAPPARTVLPYSEPPVYEFDRSGLLINWTPGTGDQKGMMSDTPVRRRGTPATVEDARGWIRGKR